MKFYVYRWFNTDNGKTFYIGKGCRRRYKEVNRRNKLFLDYYNANSCNVEIIDYFDNEQKAFEKEKELILYYKSIGECFCNLDDGGKGGVNFVWNEDMKNYMSKYNPMKDEKQRERMSKNNPMKDKNTSKKVGSSQRKIIIYKDKEQYAEDIAKENNVHIFTVYRWAKRGYDTKGEYCYYKNETIPKEMKITSSKPIYIDDIYFKSLEEAIKYLNVKDKSPLSRALKNNKKYKGHIVKYANQ